MHVRPAESCEYCIRGKAIQATHRTRLPYQLTIGYAVVQLDYLLLRRSTSSEGPTAILRWPFDTANDPVGRETALVGIDCGSGYPFAVSCAAKGVDD